MQVQDPPKVDSLTARGGQIVDTIKNLIHEGNVRKISIKQEGRTIAEFPLTFGVVGAALAPALAAAGAIAALVTDCTIEVERAFPEKEAGRSARHSRATILRLLNFPALDCFPSNGLRRRPSRQNVLSNLRAANRVLAADRNSH